jgi:transcription termination factor Rho
MAVLERSELEASPLADLHAIADQIGLDGFRRLRKAELIEAILGRSGGGDDAGAGEGAAEGAAEEDAGADRPAARRRRPTRTRRPRATSDDDEEGDTADTKSEEVDRQPQESRRRTPRARRARVAPEAEDERGSNGAAESADRAPRRSAPRGREERAPAGERAPEREAEGVVELLGNGSAFLRVSPPEASDEDVYISAAQVRRCELVSGDRVSGPVRTRRPSERYPSLARVDTINGASADSVAEGVRYEDLPVAYPTERLELDAEDATLSALEWLTPIGRGSRALIVGAARAGKTEVLRRLRDALSGREGLEVMVVLSGVRPEEIAAWREGEPPVAPAAALNLAASADLQDQTVEHVVETAKRVAARGGDVVVLIDSLDGLHPHAARKVLASARNLAEGGSLTVIATATRPLGGESTVIALDVALTSTGRLPALDLAGSGTVKPELLVGEDGAAAITKARAAAIEPA